MGTFGGVASPTSVIGGVHLFEGLPRAPLTASASQVTPTGVTVSASASLTDAQLPPAGARLSPDLELTLTPMATVRGAVVQADGSAAAGARVTLSAASQTGGLSTARLSGTDGGFEFVGVPMDASVHLEALGSGVAKARFTGRMDAGGALLDAAGQPVADLRLVLDATPPAVAAVVPVSGAVAVPTTAHVVVTFSEPIDPATVHGCPVPSGQAPTFRLLESTGTPPALNDPLDPCDDANVVPIDVSLSADGLAVTLAPRRELRGMLSHTVVVSGVVIGRDGSVVGGLSDLIGLRLAQDFVSSFETRDNVPPFVTGISPATGARDVALDSVVRVTLSEPVDLRSVSAATFAVAASSGPMEGRRDAALGNTVLIFTPMDTAGMRGALLANAAYTVTVAGLFDLAGNVMLPAAAGSTTFRTIDTIGPSVSSLIAPAGARPGESITVAALSLDDDVASMAFLVDGVVTAIVTSPVSAGRFETTIQMPDRALQITARAVDLSGNAGALSAPVAIGVLPDNPPAVRIVTPVAGSTVMPGSTVRFEVEATDDIGVAQVRMAGTGAGSASTVRDIVPATKSANVVLDVQVPASATALELVLAAAATDTRGQSSSTTTLRIPVQDETDPVLSIESPAAGSMAAPGTSVDVTVLASDLSGVREVSLAVPEIGYMRVVSIDPAEGSTRTVFTVPVPEPLAATALTLVARGTDRFGRVGEQRRSLTVLAVTFDASAARGLAADPNVASANAGQALRINGRGLSDSLVARFAAIGDAGTDATADAHLFAVAADGTAASVMVPANTVTGLVRLVNDSGTVLPGSWTLQIVPTLTALSVPAGESFEPGVVATVTGTGFRAGATGVRFPGVADAQAGQRHQRDDASHGNDPERRGVG